MDIHKRLENIMRETMNPRDQKAMMQALEIRRQDPVVQLSIAMFRDSMMFRDMAQSMILDMSCKLKESEKKIEELNERLDRALE